MNEQHSARPTETFVHRGIAREGYQYCTDNDCKCHMMPPERVVARSAENDLDLLHKVCESWVNGRKVIDGIPKTIADQVRARLRGPDSVSEPYKGPLDSNPLIPSWCKDE